MLAKLLQHLRPAPSGPPHALLNGSDGIIENSRARRPGANGSSGIQKQFLGWGITSYRIVVKSV